MREEEFKNWLRNRGLADSTVTTCTYHLKKIEECEGVDLDEEFDNDYLESLLDLYKYGVHAQRYNHPNPTNFESNTSSLSSTLAACRSHMNQYKKFCLSDDYSSIDYATLIKKHKPAKNTTYNKKKAIGIKFRLDETLKERITALEVGLQVVDDGHRYRVPSGYIDILARDNQGRYVVIELVDGVAGDEVATQTLGYMSDIAKQYKKDTRGIIVAADFNDRVRNAAQSVSNLDLISYTYFFDFKKEKT